MADITYEFNCPDCGEDLSAEIVVVSAGHGPTGMGGPPEFSSPGEGPEYYLESDVVCDGDVLDADEGEGSLVKCGRIFDDDFFQSGKAEKEICEQIAEGNAYDYNGPDTLEERDGDI